MARRYVLDTHAYVFALTDPRKLGVRARAAIERIESGTEEGFVPASVVAETLLLRGLGRIAIGVSQIREGFERVPSLRFHPLDMEQLTEFAGLGSISDPFDRLAVASARSLRATLISRDALLAESELVEVLWT